MLYAGEYQFNRRLGQGISVFNPGDKPLRQSVMTNDMLQHRLDSLLKDSNRVRYMFSNYARTNNGIYALMDIKTHNKDRLIELHNIISEGIHKVEHIEENVHSLFLALMNPEDKRNISNIHSFMDRIEYIKIPYILDVRTEVEIYRGVFGKHIDANFLPKVLHNFARAIISSRLNKRSEGLLEWIKKPEKYSNYCDRNLHLLKMEIYTGHIPTWLDEEDLKAFTAKFRKKILAESEFEGNKGFSGRDSIKIFNDFYSAYASDSKPINMSMVMAFFKKKQKDQPGYIPDGFLESLCKMYDYNVLQEVKESLYDYNEEVVAADIQDYLYALNFEMGAEIRCVYTNRKFTVNESFLKSIEKKLLGENVDKQTSDEFRLDTQREYAARTLTQEIMSDGRSIDRTDLYLTLLEKYLYHLKQKVLDPFLKNANFRRAIKDYGKEDFKTYDNKIQEDVTYLIQNLVKKYQYSLKGAIEVCIYVVDNELAQKYAKS
jgi:predicted Ser/Thr protein kinase